MTFFDSFVFVTGLGKPIKAKMISLREEKKKKNHISEFLARKINHDQECCLDDTYHLLSFIF